MFFSKNWLRYKRQILATFVANLFVLSHGIAIGWMSPSINFLQSKTSPLDTGPVTITEGSWIGSLFSIGSCFGVLFFGFMFERIGRKWTIYSLALPHLAFWFTIYYAYDVNYLYLARFLAGSAGGGSFITVPIFVAEIVDNKIRGRLASFFQMILNSGIVIGYILASYLPYRIVPMTGIVCPLLFMATMIFMPETPYYLIKKHKDEEAEKSLKFYRNLTSKSVIEELEIRQYLTDLKLTIHGEEQNRTKITREDIFNLNTIKIIIIGLFLLMLNQFSGAFAIVNYGTNIFEATGSTFDKNISTILVGIAQAIGTVLSAVFIDRYGRKILLLLSTGTMCIGLFIAGTYSYISARNELSELNWVPVTSICLVIFVASIGVTPVPFVVLVEILPAKIRSVGSIFCLICLNIMAFTVLKSFPPLVELIEIAGVLWCCGVFCGVSTFIIYFCVPETKGKQLEKADQNQTIKLDNI